jgi:hypothetical protein
MTTRRDFLKTLGVSAAGMAMGGMNTFASTLTSAQSASAKTDKVKIAYIGIGNRGEQNISEFAKTGMVDVVALCDIDMGAGHTQKVMNMYPKARRFRDFRELFDKAAADFDAVCISVPDHMHFPIAMLALANGKHVYVEKPMCRTFLEGELMMEMARKHPELATQVGNQGHSEANYFQFKAWKDAGIIKDVTAITAHMNNSRRWHKYDASMMQMPTNEPMPNADIDWDVWTGPSIYHGFSDRYHQGNWRCWYDYGMGALGDWGAHLLDTAHEFLELGLPYEIGMDYALGHNSYFFPFSSTIRFRFPARGSMPPCDITWYDGLDNLPPLPANYGASEYNPDVPATNQGASVTKLNPGKIIYSRDLTFKGGSHGSTLSMIPSANASDIQSSLPEIPKSPSNHYVNFLRACQGTEKTRSPFEINGVLSQVFCLGVIAQRLNTKLYFDARTKQFTNNAFANAMLSGMPPRQGWEDFYKLV